MNASPTQHTAADYLQMWSNAGEALQGLAKHMSATEDKMHAETRAIEALDQQRQDAAQSIAALEQDIAQTQGEISAAQTTLAVVKGTVAEAETKASIKTFKEHLASLEKELEETRANVEASREHQAADRRQHEERRAQLHASLEELRQKHAHLEQEQARFYQEAGNAHYSQIEAELEEMRQYVEKARANLAAKEQELAQAQAQVTQRLQLWPQLKLQAMRELLPRELEDEATGVLRAKLKYIEALAEHGRFVSQAFQNRRVAMDLGIDYPSVLALVTHSQQYEDTLRANRNALQALINERRMQLAEWHEQALRSEEKRLLRGY